MRFPALLARPSRRRQNMVKARFFTPVFGFALVLGVAAFAAGPLWAHHSFAVYERERTLTLSGTVKEFGWTSPHVTIQLETDSIRRGRETWAIEGSSPVVLARGGWTNRVLRPGDKVLVGVHPRKDGTAGGFLADEQQVLVNGQPAKGVLWLNPPGAPARDR
jgi:Family of unknown function (DUF6152)